MSATIERKPCELRPGIGLCDNCNLPNWPQEYCGYGFMICSDCLNRIEETRKALLAKAKAMQAIRRLKL